MDMHNKGTFAVFVVLVALAVGLVGAMIYFIINRAIKKNSTSPGQVMVQLTSPVTSGAFKLQKSLMQTGLSDESLWSYAAVLKIGRFQNEANNVVLLARGNGGDNLVDQSMLVILDNNSSDMYVAFRTLTPVDAAQKAVPYFKPFTFQSMSESTEIINKYFCVFKLHDVPYFRYFAFHVLYDYNNGIAQIFFDGNIVSVCALVECSDAGMKTHGGDTVTVGRQLPSGYTAGDSMANLNAWPGVEFRYMMVSNGLLSLAEIQSVATSYVADVYAQVIQETTAANKCSTGA